MLPSVFDGPAMLGALPVGELRRLTFPLYPQSCARTRTRTP